MTNPTNLFSNIIDQTFPNLDPETKENIRTKVLGHMLVRLEEECYTNDPFGSKALHNQMNALPDPEKSKLYGQKIGDKFASLPESKRNAIMNKLELEINGIMHQLFKQTQ